MLFRLPPTLWALLAIACGVAAALAAWQKRRNAGFWFLVGALLPLIGVALVAILPALPRDPAIEPGRRADDALGEGDRERQRAERYQPRPGTVYCRSCGAPNPEDGTFCSNCGEMLTL
jgi:predicted nucleic acid-binding Zn ribbon protein